jgi:hypothetical protein
LNSLHGFQTSFALGVVQSPTSNGEFQCQRKLQARRLSQHLLVVSVASFAAAETTKADLAKKKVDQITCEDFNGLNEPSNQP